MRKMICLLVSLVIGFSAFATTKFEKAYEQLYKETKQFIELANSINTSEPTVEEVKKVQKQYEKYTTALNKVMSIIPNTGKEVERYFSRLQNYQNKYFEIQDDETLSTEEKRTKGEKIISKIVKEIPGANRKNAIYFSKADLTKAYWTMVNEKQQEYEKLSDELASHFSK